MTQEIIIIQGAIVVAVMVAAMLSDMHLERLIKDLSERLRDLERLTRGDGR